MSAEVVVTGLGVLGPFGAGRQALLEGLRAGVPRLREVDRSAGFHRSGGARLAALADLSELGQLVPAALSRRMSPPARMAVAAMQLALRDAGIPEGADHGATGIVTGTSFGPAWVTEQLLRQILGQGPEQASPALFTESVASASAAQMAMVIRARGPNQTLTQREASDLLALGEAARWIRDGKTGRVLVGIVEESIPILHALLDRFHALARADRFGPERARPFDRHRNGLTAAEGAVVVVLESAALAEERGARPLCRLLAHGAAFDPTARSHDWGHGEVALGRSLRRFLDRSGVAPATIELIVSGASGSRAGDRLEALTLRAAWGAQALPPVVAPKGLTGEYGGGFLAAGLLAAGGEPPGPTAGFAEVDPELGLAPWTGGTALASPGVSLITSLASGGAAAWALVAPA
ncbi:MAG: beta-ketoacyl synthase chain length factor [Thermoanaerobaculia bacterium]|nr:beta-ketoacyl synthase chain length factor [Thermoanaerobaculia bacterium]